VKKGVGANRKEKAIGIVITPRELYDLVQQATLMLQRIESRLDVLEEKLEDTHATDERSRQALDTANDALELAKKNESELQWLWRTIIGGLVVSAIGALFLLIENGVKRG
jgi:predicted  nucleic acid-binding Zn-ribbon protein